MMESRWDSGDILYYALASWIDQLTLCGSGRQPALMSKNKAIGLPVNGDLIGTPGMSHFCRGAGTRFYGGSFIGPA
jgi:hypothetical protein